MFSTLFLLTRGRRVLRLGLFSWLGNWKSYLFLTGNLQSMRKDDVFRLP